MSEPLKKLYDNLITSGKTDESRIGKYPEFEAAAKSNLFDMYQDLSAMGFSEDELGDWQGFSGYVSRKLLNNPEPNITPYATERAAQQPTPEKYSIPTPDKSPLLAEQATPVEVGGAEEKPVDRPTAEVKNPNAPFKYRTADAVYVVDPSSRKAYDMNGNLANEGILSEALKGRGNVDKQIKDAQTPSQDLINRNDRNWLEAQIRDKAEQVKALRSEGKSTAAFNAPYYATGSTQTNVSEIAPIEAELTELQRQYAELEYNEVNNDVHKRLFSEFEQTPEYKALQSRYEKLIGTVPITISDEAKNDFNAKYGGELETLQAQLTQQSMEEFSKSQELTNLQGKYQKDMDEFVRANRSKPLFDSMYKEKVKAVSAELEREQVKLFNQLYGEQIDKQVSELSNNRFMEYMKANPDKFQDYNNKVQGYINNFNELSGADFEKMYGKEFQDEVGKAMLEKIKSTDFLKDDFTTNTTDFILRGVDDSVLGGLIGRISGVNKSDQQIEDFYNPTMIEGAARGALSIVVDTPLFAIPGAGGAAIAARGTSLLARRFILNAVVRGAPLKVAERAVMSAWKTRFATVSGIGGSMGALGGYDQIRDLYTQSFDDVAGIDMKQNLKATGKGLALGFGIGWIGMGSRVMNNYINKSLDNAFASKMVRRGVEQTAKAGVNLTALTVENAAFVYGGSFLEGREATPEEFGEGMVLLGFLKAKGYFSKVAEAVPLRDKPQIDFTREELEYLIKPNNKEAWKRVNEMGELEMRSVFEDPNAPLTMKMKIAASRGVTVDDTMINTDGAKAVVLSDNGRFFVEYRDKEGQLIQKAEFKTAEEASTQAMTLEALTVAKEAMTKYDKLGATEKAKVNAELKPEEKQAVADVVDGKVTEEGFVAVEKLHRLTNEEIKKEDAKIEENQKRLGLPNTPETALSGQTKETIAKLERGEPVPNEFLEQASRELYENYKKVESIKNSTNRKFTTDQIEKSSSELGKMIEFLENAKSLQKESGRFISEVDALDGTNKVDRVAPKEVKSEEAKPVAEAKPVEAEVKPVEEVKPEVKTVEAVAPEVKPTQEAKVEPTPEVKAEPEKAEAELRVEPDKAREELSDIDAAITELRQNNPKEFKKDGTLKANSKLSATLKSLIDRQNKLIEEFPERSAVDKEKSRIQTEEINRQFEERQAQLAESTKITKEEILEASIEDKLRFRAELSKEEIDYANENYFVPKGFRFGKFGLETIKTETATKAEPKSAWATEQAAIESNTKLTAEQKEAAKVESTAKALEGKDITDVISPTEINLLNKKLYNQLLNKQKELLAKGVKDFDSDADVKLIKEQIALSESLLANDNKTISEAYHKAKSDGSNPELVRAVEKLLGQSVQEGVQAKPAPTAEVGKEGVQVDVQAKRKALDDSIAALKETLKPKMGIIFDPKKEAEDMYRMHKAIVDVAKKAIDYYGTKVIKTAEDFAKVLGTKLTKPIRLAYEEAAGIATYTAETLKYNYGRAVEQLSNITATPEKTVGVAARDISRRETTKVLIDEFKALKDQIRLESKSAKQAATYIAKFLDANKKEIAAAGLTVRDSVRIQKVAIKSEKSAIDLMDRLINDGEYRQAVRDAEKSKQQIKKAILSGEFNRMSKSDKETLNKIATVDLEGHYFSKEFLDAYNGMSKEVFSNRRVPSPDAIGKFYSLFEQDVIDNHVRKELAQDVDAKTVETISTRLNSLYDQLQEWNADPSLVDKREIALAKGRLSYLMNKASNFIKNGVFEVESQKVKDLDTRLTELENFINNEAEPINKAIEGVESAYKNAEIKGLNLDPISGSRLTENGVNRYAKETAERLRRALKTARNSDISDKLSLNDIDNIKAVLSAANSGLLPKITTSIISKIETADLVNKSGKEIIEALKNNIETSKAVKDLLAKYPTTQSLSRGFDKWDKADIDKLLDLEKRRKGKPVEELITGALEQPILTSNKEIDAVMRPVDEARAKALAAKIWNPVEYFRNKSKAETYDNMIGIALRSLNHIANLPNTLKKAEVNGEYEIVQADGKRYQEDGSPRKFASIDEANTFIRNNVEKFFTADELDFYHTVNFGKFKTQRANARIFEKALLTEIELGKFDKAYEELKKLTGKDRVYFKTFDELTSTLPAKFKPYIEAMRDALASTGDMATEVASREGVNFVRNTEYWPYPNKELGVGKSGSTDIKDFASTMRAENVKSGNIYERTQSVHYTDFNARRVFNDYMRTMITDYYMNPESKVVLSALREVSKGLGKEYRRDEGVSADAKVVVDALEQLIKDRFVAHLNSHQLFGNAIVGNTAINFDLGKGVRNVLGFGRSTALISAARRVIPEPASNLSKIVLGFVRGGDSYNPLRIADRYEKMLPVISEVAGSVRSLSSERFQKGNYSQFELQQERNAIREFSEKYILQLGDMLTMRPLWMTKFETRFKELTGKELDPNRFTTDENYKDANYDAVLRSMRYADSVIEEVFPAQTKFGRAQTGAFGIRTASDVGALNMIMNSFGVRESSTFVLALRDLKRGSNLGVADAAGRLAGLTMANFIWLASGQAVYAGTKYLFGLINDDEAAKDKAMDAWSNAFSAEGITTNLVANTFLLLTGRYANAGRLIAGLAAGFAIDKILDAEVDPIERANMRKNIQSGMAQLRTIGLTVPESESDKVNMLFPIVAQSMTELGVDAANVGSYVVDLGKKVADGTASEDDIQMWTLLKATHDVMILKGYTHPFTKEMNMYLREKSRGELKSVETFKSSVKQLYNTAAFKPEKAEEITGRIRALYENFKKKSIDDSNSFEAMWGAKIAADHAIEKIEALSEKEAADIAKIKRLPYPERYKYLQDKFENDYERWKPYMTKGFDSYLDIKDKYETGSVEEREKMFELE